MNWFGLALLGAVIFCANGASVATKADEKHNCTVADGFQAITCLLRMNDFVEKIDELDMDNKEEVKEFKKSCDSLQNCFSSLNCRGKSDVETAKVTGMIKTYCDAVIYVSVEFAACSDKLEEKKSSCFDDWDPFPDEEEKKEVTEEVKKEQCKNFFGKDNCLKKEITETCSEKEWVGFRDHFLSLNAMMKQCDFSKTL